MFHDGVRALLSHGHRLKVQNGLDKLYHKMVKEDAQIALFGHLHTIVFQHCQGRYLINPGSIGSSRGPEGESYLVMEFKEATIDLSWHDAHSHEVTADTKIDRQALKDV